MGISRSALRLPRHQIEWENRGSAPAYQRFALRAKLTGTKRTLTLPLGKSDNLAWMPGSECNDRYSMRIPTGTPPGRYAFSVALLDTTIPPERVIEIGLKETLRGPDGYYRLAEIDVQSPERELQPRMNTNRHESKEAKPGWKLFADFFLWRGII